MLLKRLNNEIDEIIGNEDLSEPSNSNNSSPEQTIQLAEEPYEDIDNLSDYHEFDNKDEEEKQKIEQKKLKKPSKRQTWDETEVAELNKYFGECLRSGVCPSKSAVQKAQSDSKKNGGKIYKRFWHTIVVKKISAMNMKSKQQ